MRQGRVIGVVAILAAVFVILAVFSGCQRMPRGVQDALYTAQITMERTAKDANDAAVYPYRPNDPNETDAVRADRMALVANIVVRTMVQANKNLKQVVLWSRGDTEDLKDGK